MTPPKFQLTISDDLILCRSINGIKLIKPADISTSDFSYNTGHTVASLMKLPFNFYFLNMAGETLHMNDQCVEVCGFESVSDSVGKSLFSVSESESAQRLINNCSEVITTNKIKIFEENNVRKDGVSLQFLSIKSPWYDANNNIIGLFGCSIVLGKQSLSEALLKISELGLLNPSGFTINSTFVPNIKQGNEQLSERESLCVYHVCKGFTVKQVAKILDISPKTVETYIERAKQKLHCQNKAELISVFSKQAS